MSFTALRKGLFMAGVAAVILTGCNLAPDYKTPATPDTAQFKEAPQGPVDLQAKWSEGKPAAEANRGQWWLVFNDRQLGDLLLQAASGNNDLAAMAARIEQARQLARIEGASLFPAISGNASVQRQLATTAGTGFNFPVSPATVYSAGLGLTYEIDLFGRARNSRRAAEMDFASAAYGYNSMLLALQADAAQLYFALRGQDASIKLLEQTVKLREDSLGILKSRRDAGTVTDLEVSQNIVDLENTRAQLQQLQADRAVNEHALAVLLGKAPAEFSLPVAPLSAEAPKVPAGIPSEVLQRRPDIAAAQYDLMAANARIGVARAAFFPSLSLTASGGFASETVGHLFDWSSRTWAIGPLMTLPIFQGGRIVADNERAKAKYEETVAGYRQKVLVAFQDVEDALARLKMRDAQAGSYSRAADAAARAAKLAADRYQSGDTGYLEEIEAKESALAASLAVIQTQSGRLSDTVQLIRALGGDWTGVAQAAAAPDAKPMQVTPAAREDGTPPKVTKPKPSAGNN